jgi:anaerobic dimethyl sulfoxide reductase subunit B (iron-sulfur subunit)
VAKQYGFLVNTDRCVQCHACEVACKAWHGVEPGIRWRRVVDTWSGQFPAVTNQTISYSCMHCLKPACVDICPERAISKRAEDGIVVVDPSKCKGCRSCAAACPFHIPEYGKTGRMQKCNLCLERLEQGKQPLCVATCPGEALRSGTMETLIEISSAKSAERLSAPSGPSFLLSGKLPGAAFLRLLNSNR